MIRAVSPNHTIQSCLVAAAKRLARVSDSPRLDAELLLAHVMGVSRAWLVAHADDPAAAGPFESLVARRVSGEPLAYILGFRDFWKLSLIVTPAVLVPRPETELLVELALRHPPAPARLLDLGTGSGAIALALASERPNWAVTATDVSPEALAVARANAVELDLTRVELLQGSWYEPVAGRGFDLIVSNPPYVGQDDPELAHPTLGHEPQSALTPGRDGMAALRAIIEGAPRHLARNGWLLLEHGYRQAEKVARELVARGFGHVRSHRDLAGHERVTEARWN
jgi:release factor glutamine methyltransferase